MSHQGDAAATNNVIDFNRESEEDAGATESAGVPQSVVDRLQNELSEAHRQFEQELEQRHTEIKLLRQALAVAKSRMQTGEESAKNAQALQQEVASLRESLATAESRLADGESLGRNGKSCGTASLNWNRPLRPPGLIWTGPDRTMQRYHSRATG